MCPRRCRRQTDAHDEEDDDASWFRAGRLMSSLFAELVVVAFVTFAVGAVTNQWLMAASLPVLWAIWRFLRLKDGPPVLAFAFTFHWGQIVIGLFYYAATGREPLGMRAPLYGQMVGIGLVCVLTFIVGILIGDYFVSQKLKPRPMQETSVGWSTLLVAYVAILVFRTSLRELAWSNQGLAQGMLAITYIRFALFYLILRRLVKAERYPLAAAFAVVEVALGMTGFFAEFREPLFIAAVVLAEQFDYRRAQHWVSFALVAAVAVFTGVLWIGIRGTVRENFDDRAQFSTTEKLSYTSSLVDTWWKGNGQDKLTSLDEFVDRMWDVYYPALALERVPKVLPHTDGEIMMTALTHIFTPRILVPGKADLESDSLQVRKYSGMAVAGPEQGTTISFGYEIQGYIDYGIPGLFVPVLLYAIFMGAAYRFFLRMIRHRELGVAIVTVIFWMSLYGYNRAWAKMLGLSLTLMVYLGGVTFLIDRYLSSNPNAADDLAARRAAAADSPFY
jgi:hypothetical protein